MWTCIRPCRHRRLGAARPGTRETFTHLGVLMGGSLPARLWRRLSEHFPLSLLYRLPHRMQRLAVAIAPSYTAQASYRLSLPNVHSAVLCARRHLLQPERPTESAVRSCRNTKSLITRLDGWAQLFTGSPRPPQGPEQSAWESGLLGWALGPWRREKYNHG